MNLRIFLSGALRKWCELQIAMRRDDTRINWTAKFIMSSSASVSDTCEDAGTRSGSKGNSIPSENISAPERLQTMIHTKL